MAHHSLFSLGSQPFINLTMKTPTATLLLLLLSSSRLLAPASAHSQRQQPIISRIVGGNESTPDAYSFMTGFWVQEDPNVPSFQIRVESFSIGIPGNGEDSWKVRHLTHIPRANWVTIRSCKLGPARSPLTSWLASMWTLRRDSSVTRWASSWFWTILT